MLRNKQIFDIADKCDEGQEGNEFLVAFAYAIESTACAERDARIADLEAANEAFGKRQEWWNARMLELEQQLAEARKVLKETGLLLHNFWCGVQMNDYSFDKLNKCIEAIDAAIKEQT